MFGMHTPELLIVLAIAVLLFGARRLPEMGSAVGRTIKEFQKSMREDASQVTPPVAPAQLQVMSAAQPSLTAPAAHATSTMIVTTAAGEAVAE